MEVLWSTIVCAGLKFVLRRTVPDHFTVNAFHVDFVLAMVIAPGPGKSASRLVGADP